MHLTTKWPATVERAGDIDWRAACDALAPLIDPQQAFERLRSDAQALRGLPDVLGESGLPASVMNHPAIALKNLEQRMKEWTLI